ncbi:PulJ/GspJ family protein [Cerasicoccus maritimus]|uniref:PulJ/GspJ family protein n=1 Tax=Cerasicoccus maritimus TaxID=490089 RepID=UPI0028524DE6|nr:prepilin-type N-terminal cleavage/methylation domain-containing protein [Cerasicoccus maritimus]
MASPQRRQAGFTLAELLIAVSIATFVLTGAISMFIQFSKTNLSMAARSEFDRQMRTTLQRISADTRVAANASITGNTSIALTLPSGSNPQNIYYQYNSKTQELMRAEGTGDYNMILSNVSNFSVKQSGDTVSYYINFSKDVGDRNITLDRDVSFRMRN